MRRFDKCQHQLGACREAHIIRCREATTHCFAYNGKDRIKRERSEHISFYKGLIPKTGIFLSIT